jgi:hypothetical protein
VIREIFRVAPQGKPGPFQIASERLHAGLAGSIPDVSADLVERVSSPLYHVERVHAQLGVVALGLHDVGDPLCSVGRYEADLLTALLA